MFLGVLSSVTGMVLLLVLGASVAGHLASFGKFVGAIEAHEVLKRHQLAVGVLVAFVEALIFLSLAYGLIVGRTAVTRTASVAAAGLFVVFTTYLALAIKRTDGRSAICGCGVGEMHISGPALVRSMALVLLSIASAMARPLGDVDAVAAAVVVLISVSIALLVVWLPVAFAQAESLERDWAVS